MSFLCNAGVCTQNMHIYNVTCVHTPVWLHDGSVHTVMGCSLTHALQLLVVQKETV